VRRGQVVARRGLSQTNIGVPNSEAETETPLFEPSWKGCKRDAHTIRPIVGVQCD
jgi:hypothetical protein